VANRAIEIHDSVLERVLVSQGQAELHFSRVFVHQSEGEPLHDAGRVWVQKAILRVCDVNITSAFSEFPVDLDGGETRIGRETLENRIPVALHQAETFEIRSRSVCEPRNVVSFEGRAGELDLIGEPDYVEEFPPKKES